ncbi:MAG: AAA domain-containing protein [Phycisphaera sp.]|nr:AAA domain-containing protein [Phycisphaera sp.]
MTRIKGPGDFIPSSEATVSITDSSALTTDDAALLQQASEGYANLRSQIGRVIIGQEQIVRQLLAAIFSEGHVLVVGVPGLAKTLLVKTLSDALGWSFKRIQFTPDMMPADIIGMELLQEDESGSGSRAWRFMKGPIFANMILADEINRTPPKTQAALLEGMQEYTVTSMGRSYPLDKPFVVIATQNPIEQEGTYPLPEAQLDRFMFSLWVDYPSRDEEELIVEATTAPRDTHVDRVYTQEQMVAFQQLVRRMPVSKHVIKYAVSIARSTRPDDAEASDFVKRYVEWGAGPRAGQNLILAGKAFAVLDGKPAVSAEHVRAAALPVLRHRVLPNYTATGEGISAAKIIERVLHETKEPRY